MITNYVSITFWRLIQDATFGDIFWRPFTRNCKTLLNIWNLNKISSNFMHFRMWITSRMYQKEVNFDLRIVLKFCHRMTVLTGDLIHQNNTAVTFQFDYIIDCIGCFFFFKDIKFISQYNISYSIFFFLFWICFAMLVGDRKWNMFPSPLGNFFFVGNRKNPISELIYGNLKSCISVWNFL